MTDGRTTCAFSIRLYLSYLPSDLNYFENFVPFPDNIYALVNYKAINYNNIHRWGFGLIEFYDSPPAYDGVMCSLALSTNKQ